MLVPNAVSAEFFHTDAGIAFVDLLINGNRETSLDLFEAQAQFDDPEREVMKGCELLDGATSLRQWQRQHARCSAEAHGRQADDAPSVGPDLDGAPTVIGEIEIDVTPMLGEAR
jgi:hypothetical protein